MFCVSALYKYIRRSLSACMPVSSVSGDTGFIYAFHKKSKRSGIIMGLNDTPSGERVHIGFFGRRNAGKSSVVNAFTNQELAIVSDTPGTTTDPVYKAMELLPMGPVIIIDTPGYDDEGALGELRVKKTSEVLGKTDCAVLVTDCTRELDESEKQLIKLFEGRRIPYVIAKNKSDLLETIPA